MNSAHQVHSNSVPMSPKMAGGGSDNGPLSIKHVTPELAAQVVKHFVLPMFDTDQKKGLRRKYGRMQAATVTSSFAGQKVVAQHQLLNQSQLGSVNSTAVGQKSEAALAAAGGGSTVLGDLKLTEHLANQLEDVGNKFDQMQERLEQAQLERDTFKKKFIQLSSKSLEQKKNIEFLKQQLERQVKMNMGLEIKCE